MKMTLLKSVNDGLSDDDTSDIQHNLFTSCLFCHKITFSFVKLSHSMDIETIFIICCQYI